MSAWREGDPVGNRQFVTVGPVELEAGGRLESVRVAYETWGTLAPDASNAVLVCHALTGDSHVTGSAGDGHTTPGWWGSLVGPGEVVDTGRYFVVAANVLGGCQGTSGPADPGPTFGSAWPLVTTRDQVAVEVALADALGVQRWASVLGGSMGGMRVLEWLASHPTRVASALLLACPAAASADQIGWCTPQLRAITGDDAWDEGNFSRDGDGPVRGLATARRIAHMTYRTAVELEERFGKRLQDEQERRYQVESYLDHQAEKLVGRFDAGSYVALTRGMNTHDVSRGRGSLADALRPAVDAGARVCVAGIDTDRLYPLHLQAEIAEALGVPLQVVASPYGHDGFLLEVEQVGKLVQDRPRPLTVRMEVSPGTGGLALPLTDFVS